jgi:hypothetical protein
MINLTDDENQEHPCQPYAVSLKSYSWDRSV